MTDIVLNIHEAKSNLSKYLNSLGAGDRIVLCKRNRPIAEVRLLLSEPKRKKRRLGVAKGEFTVTEAFFEPLPPELLDAFEGNLDAFEGKS